MSTCARCTATSSGQAVALRDDFGRRVLPAVFIRFPCITSDASAAVSELRHGRSNVRSRARSQKPETKLTTSTGDDS